MTKTFVIADMHGRHDLLLSAIEHIEQASHSGGTVIFTGDYVDRGPESRQIIDRLISGPTDAKRWKWICLQGNHEAMMLECLSAPVHIREYWLPNGGGNTLLSYGAKEGDSIYDAAALVPQEHRDWLAVLPLIHTDNHRVYVHAGVDETIPLDEQSAQTMQWMLYPSCYEGGHGQRHVVHGHHQFEVGPMLYYGRTNLDTFAWFTGRLVIGVFDDDKAGGPVSTITVQGPTIHEIKKASK